MSALFGLFLLLICHVSAQVGLDRPCARDVDCLAPNSMCSEGSCTCASGYVRGNYPARCLQVPKSKNDPCEDDMQCTEAFTLGSFCGESNRCDCYPSYHFIEGVCAAGRSGEVAINDRCAQSSECSVEGSYCKDGMYCACEEDKVASKDHKRCLPLANDVGEKCEEDIQCTENLLLGAQCRSGTCQCRPEHHYSEISGNKGCYKDKKIGEVCSTVQECTSKPDPMKVSCNSVCECNHPYTASDDKTVCNGGSILGGFFIFIAASLLTKILH